MSCCCTNTYLGFCAVGTCVGDEIDTGVAADQTGTYQLVVSFLGADYIITEDFNAADDLVFPTNGLNEEAEMSAHIIKPDGTKVEFVENEDGVTYDCFILKTKISYALN